MKSGVICGTTIHIRVSRSLRDTAYKAIYARESYDKKISEGADHLRRSQGRSESRRRMWSTPWMRSKVPVSLYDPVYTDGGDALYVMDQISDKKNREENVGGEHLLK